MDFFSPLTNKKYCNYFYYFSVLSFILMVIFMIITLLAILKFRKKMNYSIILHLTTMVMNGFLLYFSNRLWYSMCVKNL